ncbi:MAG: hypothetical protein ACRCYV_04150 [Aeromonas sp.]
MQKMPNKKAPPATPAPANDGEYTAPWANYTKGNRLCYVEFTAPWANYSPGDRTHLAAITAQWLAGSGHVRLLSESD